MSNYTEHETATIQPSRTAFTMDALLDDMEVPTMANDTDFEAKIIEPSGTDDTMDSQVDDLEIQNSRKDIVVSGSTFIANQLPSVEEYKASLYASTSSRHKPRKWLRAKVIVVAITLLTVLLAVLGTVFRNDEDELLHREKLVKELTNNIVNQELSQEEHLNLRGTPQYAALDWLIRNDPKGIVRFDLDELKERYILAVLYMALEGQQWAQKLDFLSKKHVCKWSDVWKQDKDSAAKDPDSSRTRVGVTCNNKRQVTGIFLPHLGLDGKIPSEIGFLGLTELNLAGNAIRGVLPASMSKLTKLTDLILHDTEIGGELPYWLVEMTSLQRLNLAATDMKGTFPLRMDRMTNLEFVNLEDTNLGGNLNNLQGLTQLRALFLGNCDLEDFLTFKLLESWPNLEVMDISNNSLEGNLPDNLLQHTKLRVIDLSDNFFAGSMPNAILERGSVLESLNLELNDLDGNIPTELGQLTTLTRLDLSFNDFIGALPEEIGNLKELEYFYLSNCNSLSPGSIPLAWGYLTKLKDLSLQGTNRNGELPGSMVELKQILMLDLGNNSLKGPLDLLGDLTSLRFLFLNNNQFDGLLPQSFANLVHLIKLHLHSNDFLAPSVDASYCENLPAITTSNEPLDEFVIDCSTSDQPQCVTKCCGGDVNCDKYMDTDLLREKDWNSPLQRSKYTFGGKTYDLIKDLNLSFDDDDGFEALQKNLASNHKNIYAWAENDDDDDDDDDDGEWIGDDDDVYDDDDDDDDFELLGEIKNEDELDALEAEKETLKKMEKDLEDKIKKIEEDESEAPK